MPHVAPVIQMGLSIQLLIPGTSDFYLVAMMCGTSHSITRIYAIEHALLYEILFL